MADTKINDLPEMTVTDPTDVLPIVDDTGGTPATEKITLDTLLGSGWLSAGETWTYASSDDPAYTFTISAFDATTKYSPGMRVKLTDTGVQYFIITKVVFDDPGSTITVYGGTDYDLSTGAITLPFYSTQKAPLDFPLDPNKWTEETSSSSNSTQATPSAGTWYNNGGNIVLPIGSWNVRWDGRVGFQDASSVAGGTKGTLSKANNTEDDDKWTTANVQTSATNYGQNQTREGNITISTKDTYYLNVMTPNASIDTIGFYGVDSATTIRAVYA